MKDTTVEYTKKDLLVENIRIAFRNYADDIVDIDEGVIFIIESVAPVLKAARVEALEILTLAMQAFDPQWPGACHQDCFDVSDGHGYKMQEAARDSVEKFVEATNADS